MQKEIPFGGLSAIPDDYQCPDGHLDIAYNLIPEDGHLTPILQPHVVATLGKEIVFIHRTAAFTHYIARSGHALHCYVELSDNATSAVIKQFSNDVTILSFNAIGNTLIVLCSDGMHYFLWKSQNNAYADLGSHIPELPLSFGLQGESKLGTIFYVDLWANGTGYRLFTDNENDYDFDASTPSLENQITAHKNMRRSVTDTVMAKTIQFIAEKGTKEGRFVMPFLVRYAFRLFDGSLTMHSAPVLMITDSGTAPHAFFNGYLPYNYNNDDGEQVTLINQIITQIGGIVCDLDYQCLLDTTALDNIKNIWGDVVKSVDIFVSAPLYRFDQSGEVKGWHTFPTSEGGFTISKTTDDATYKKQYALPVITGANNGTEYREFILPTISDDAFYNSVKDTCNFYLVKSINIEDIATTRTKIDIAFDLSTLPTREAMTDDYDSHDTLMPNFLYTYNNRINLANIDKLLAPPAHPAAIIPFCQSNLVDDTSVLYDPLGDAEWFPSYSFRYKVYVFVKTDNGQFIVQSDTTVNNILAPLAPFQFFYYPNDNAYKAVLKIERDKDNLTIIPFYYLLPLTPHAMLNGAYFFDTFSPSLQLLASDSYEVTMINGTLQPAVVSIPNKIYISEVNNPFQFPVTGINTVGSGTIIGIASAARPLSTGQFGQFPLYAFCSDGIWALQVSATGGYSAVQPIARDVCSDADSLTQLDSSVLFATSRGIMQISGSTVQCITDIIANDYPLAHSVLPRLGDLFATLTPAGSDTTVTLPTIASFGQFLVGARLLYDYTYQRILLFNPSQGKDERRIYPYAYVFSLKSNQWGMMYTDLKAPLNSYPDALAINDANQLVSFDTSDDTDIPCFAVTRPLKLDAPDTLKTVRDLIQRGIFENGDVKTALYGSRDLHNWHLIATSANHKLRSLLGTPYKYFRLVTLGTALSHDKSIAGASVVYQPKQTNQLR